MNAKFADKKRTRKKKTDTTRALVKKLDVEFSRFVRMSAADEGGTVTCVTCGRLMHWKEAHAAHFISRRHMALRWSVDPPNVHVCCPRCNLYESGALEEYSRFIIDTYGMNTFRALLTEKRTIKKWAASELYELWQHYKTAAKEQAARLGIGA